MRSRGLNLYVLGELLAAAGFCMNGARAVVPESARTNERGGARDFSLVLWWSIGPDASLPEIGQRFNMPLSQPVAANFFFHSIGGIDPTARIETDW
jgi:hypothetical protein